MAGRSGEVTAQVAAAIARVLEVNPALLRSDTPLAELGLDDMALVAVADLLEAGGHVADESSFADALRNVRTVGDLGDALVSQNSDPSSSGHG